MKINWGVGIVIAFVLFISFIMYFIIKMSVDERYEHDMVTDHYYKKEAEFQEKIDRQSATNAARMDIEITSESEGVLLKFPTVVSDSLVQGNVYFYRPSDKKKDFNITLNVVENKMLVPDSLIFPGRWDVEVSYRYKGGQYMTKAQILR